MPLALSPLTATASRLDQDGGTGVGYSIRSKYPPAKPVALIVNRSKRLAQIMGRLKAARLSEQFQLIDSAIFLLLTPNIISDHFLVTAYG